MKVKYYEKFNEIAQIYLDKLANTNLVLPTLHSNCRHVFHQFVST